jgi:hypothetical protein
MNVRTSILFAGVIALISCDDPTKPPAVDVRPVEGRPPATTETPPPKPEATATPEPPPGSRIVLAEKKVDDSWSKMLVAGGRLWVVTTLNRWTTGPMYVPAARLWSVPITGGEMTHHLDLEGLASLAADETSLYVAVNRTIADPSPKRPTGRILRLPLDGKPVEDLVMSIAPSILAVDGDTIWFDGFRMKKGDSAPPASSGLKGVLAFAFDDDNVYVTTGKDSGEPVKPGGKNGRVVRMPKNGGAKTVIASDLPDEPSGLAVDGTHVYVAAVTFGSEATENAGVIARVPKQGGDLEILAGDQPLLRAAWVSGDHVYARSGRPGRPGTILRVAKSGGPVETVVSEATLAHATMHGASLYFSTDGTFQKEPFARLTPAVVVRLVPQR